MALELWQKAALVVGVLAIAGGGVKHAEEAAKDPNQIYGPSQIGDDVGNGLDDVVGGFGDGVGNAFGKSDIAKAGAVGAGAYGAGKAWKKWGGGKNKDDPVPVPEGAGTPSLPSETPMLGVGE